MIPAGIARLHYHSNILSNAVITNLELNKNIYIYIAAMLKIPKDITALFFLYHSKVCLFFYFLLHLAHYIQAFLHYMHELITSLTLSPI